MKPAQLTVDEALRVVGHLLEHHPATRAAARDVLGEAVFSTSPRASCWCLTGALSFVAKCFDVRAFDTLWDRTAAVLGLSSRDDLAYTWDHDPAWRAEAVEKLKRAGLPAAEGL